MQPPVPLSSVPHRALFFWVALVALLVIGKSVELRITMSNDIPHIWAEGMNLAEGRNPYASIRGSDMLRAQDYYAIYLPGFYILTAGTYFLGLRQFQDWIPYWFTLCILMHWMAGALVWEFAWRQGNFWLGLPLAAFLWLNRWALATLCVPGLECAILLAISVAVLLYATHKRASFLVLGLSLAIKQAAVFVVPLFLVWAWRDASPDRRLKETARAALLICGIPIAVSVPFFFWSPSDFLRSILFSVSRVAESEFHAPSIEAYWGLESSAGKLPMLALFATIYWAALKGHIGRFVSIFFVFAVYACFSPVLFSQYMHWMVALVPLAVLEASRAPAPER